MPVPATCGGFKAGAKSAVDGLLAVKAVLSLNPYASEAPDDQEEMLHLCACGSASSQSESMEADREAGAGAEGAAAAVCFNEEERKSDLTEGIRPDCGGGMSVYRTEGPGRLDRRCIGSAGEARGSLLSEEEEARLGLAVATGNRGADAELRRGGSCCTAVTMLALACM